MYAASWSWARPARSGVFVTLSSSMISFTVEAPDAIGKWHGTHPSDRNRFPSLDRYRGQMGISSLRMYSQMSSSVQDRSGWILTWVSGPKEVLRCSQSSGGGSLSFHSKV